MSEDVGAIRVRFRNEYPSPEAENIANDIKVRTAPIIFLYRLGYSI